MPNNNLFYNSRIEIFMALCDVTYSYYIGPKGNFTSHRPVLDQFIIAYWKQTGALQWIEKSRSETLDGKLNLQFSKKVIIDYEDLDVASISLRFDIFHDNLFGYNMQHGEKHCWSSIQIGLENLVYAGPKGLLIPLKLKLENLPEYLEHTASNTVPGSIFLRAEFIEEPNYAVLMKFNLEVSPFKPANKYFLEFYRMNSEGWLEVSNPYTLIDRRFNPFEEYGVVYEESNLSNGDLDRILKVEIFKKSSSKKKGFTLFTMRSLMESKSITSKLEITDFKCKKKFELTIKMCQNATLTNLRQYEHNGLKITSIFAVDYSESNVDENLHQMNLHKCANNSSKTSYEEALEILANTTREFCTGDSVFYSFGSSNSPESHISPISRDTLLNSLLSNYREALTRHLLDNLEINKICSKSSKASSDQQHQKQQNVDELSSSSSSQCIPQMACKSSKKGRGCLTPLLEDVLELLLTRESNFEYYVLFILTDGEIADEPNALHKLLEFRSKPISIVFIGCGLGDFEILQSLIKGCKVAHLTDFIQLVHFRSITNWSAAINYYKFKTHPSDIFQKEILTSVKDQALNFLRIRYPSIR